MELSRPVALLCIVIALATGACSKKTPATKADAQAPPPGFWPEAHVAAGGVVPPAANITSSKSGSRENVAAGGNLFASMNCDGCHGGGATGWVGPSLIDGRWRYGGAEEEVFSSIYYGRPKGMPAYGGVIGTDGVWMLVAYLKSQTTPSVVPTIFYEQQTGAAPAVAAPTAAAEPTAATASAGTPEQMMARYGCVACHAVDRKVVGPSFKEVAAKYKGHPDVENTLAAKVKNGGSGVWGSVPMPPNPQIPDTDLHALVKWMLTQQ